jgi:small subunit ribosomal protein S7
LRDSFIDALTRAGKKGTATRVFSGTLDAIRRRISGRPPLEVLAQAVELLKPTVEICRVRVGQTTRQVPKQVRRQRQQSLAIRRIIHAAQARTSQPMYVRLADEIVRASHL